MWGAVCGWYGGGGSYVSNGSNRSGGSGGSKETSTSKTLTGGRITGIVFASNFLGIFCARSLHYQFYCWYFHTIPFLLIGWARLHPMIALPVMGMIVWCWNVYPSTVMSSGGLLAGHLVVLGAAYSGGIFGRGPGSAVRGEGDLTWKKSGFANSKEVL